MDVFKPFTDFLTDKERPLSRKAAFAVLVAVLLYFTDDVFGFSDYYNTGRKVEQTASINAALADTTLDGGTRADLTALRTHILRRTSLKVRFEDWLVSLGHSSTGDTTRHPPVVAHHPPGQPVRKAVAPRDNLWFLLSTSGLTLLYGIVVGVVLLFSTGQSVLVRIASAIVILLVFLLLGWLFYWVGGLLNRGPIRGSWNWNYAVNWIIQVVFYSGFGIAVTAVQARNRRRRLAAQT